jgi:hypothetical protein
MPAAVTLNLTRNRSFALPLGAGLISADLKKFLEAIQFQNYSIKINPKNLAKENNCGG